LVQATLQYVGEASLQMANLDISLCVWFWRWYLLYLLNQTNNRISGRLVLSRPLERRKAFGTNNWPILWEASRTLHEKYQGPSFYINNAIYTRNKTRNISYFAG
jgi:hypothetical protein